MLEQVEIVSGKRVTSFANVPSPARVPALVGAVGHVVGLSSYLEMVWVEAGRVIAGMQNYVVAVQVCAEKNVGRDLMGAIQLLIAKALHPVSIRVFGSGPVPAASYGINDGVANHASF